MLTYDEFHLQGWDVTLPTETESLSARAHSPPKQNNIARVLNCISRALFLTVRPDERLSTTVKTGDFSHTNGTFMADTLTAERLPKPLRFLALVLSSLALRTILYTITSGITGAELAAVSRDNSSGWQIGGMLAFKTAEIAIPWYAAYDRE